MHTLLLRQYQNPIKHQHPRKNSVTFIAITFENNNKKVQLYTSMLAHTKPTDGANDHKHTHMLSTL